MDEKLCLFIPEYEVFCTGDEVCQVSPSTESPAHKTHYAFTQMVLPMSTFAIAIGKGWECVTIVPKSNCDRIFNKDIRCNHDPYPCHVQRGDCGKLHRLPLSSNKSGFKSDKPE